MKEMKIVIGKDGNSNIETSGFTGGGCSKAVESILLAVGGQEVKEDKKPEYYEGGDNFDEITLNR